MKEQSDCGSQCLMMVIKCVVVAEGAPFVPLSRPAQQQFTSGAPFVFNVHRSRIGAACES